MAYLERLNFTLKFDPHYDQETIKLLSEETFFTNVLLINEHYSRARKGYAAKLASGLFHVSTLARETWATTDGNPLCTMSRLERF